MEAERSTKAAEVLGELSQCLNRMMQLLTTTAGMIRPSSSSTLPTVTATLSGIVQATENAALQVLDEAEALQEDQQRLSEALERLRGCLPIGDAEALKTWEEASACSKAFSARATKFMAAMEFQDLAAQHIDHTVRSIEDVRHRLHTVLALFDLPHEGAAPEPSEGSKIGDPAQSFGSRQALADQLLSELR